MTLRELRQQSGKTAAAVAAELGVTERAIYNYESGIRHINIEQIIPLSRLYDCSAEETINAQLIAIGKS